jgi:hypothetical protein
MLDNLVSDVNIALILSSWIDTTSRAAVDSCQIRVISVFSDKISRRSVALTPLLLVLVLLKIMSLLTIPQNVPNFARVEKIPYTICCGGHSSQSCVLLAVIIRLHNMMYMI